MPDRILPEQWLYDPELAKLREDSFAFLTRVALRMDDYDRLGIGTSPEQPDLLCSLLYPLNRRVQVSDVARRLNDLKMAGVILIRNSDRGWYLQVCERYTYIRSEVKQPKWGEKIKPTVEQGLLAIGPVPMAAVPKLKKKGVLALNHSSSESKTHSQSSLGDSGAVAQVDSGQASGKYAKDEGEFPGDSAWSDFCRLLAMDMITCGALWVKRWKQNRIACVEAMQDWMTKPPEERAKGNAAAYITIAYGNSTQISA